MKREEGRRRKGSIKGKLFSIPITEKRPIKNGKNSGIKTVIFYCFEKVLIIHSSRKLYDVFSEEAPYFIAQFPMVRKIRQKIGKCSIRIFWG